jgi:hypothetical protein
MEHIENDSNRKPDDRCWQLAYTLNDRFGSKPDIRERVPSASFE